MKIEDVLARELVLADTSYCDRESCLGKMVHRIQRMYTCLDGHSLTKDLLERERMQSTALGGGLAVPHVYHDQFQQVVIAVARCAQGIPFDDAPDAEPVRAVFLLLLPAGRPELHLTLLARIGRLMDRPDFMMRFLAAPDSETLYDEIVDMDGSTSTTRPTEGP
ncbi:MAG: PTS sugar transporter subunit IIA [Pseudomonadota bacterium]